MTDERIVTFEKGEALEVPVARIEQELTVLWRAAARNDAARAVTRACLWNLIVRPDGEAWFDRAKALVDEVAQKIPARALVLRVQPEAARESLRAFVEANWLRADGGGSASGSDEVTLWACGRAVQRLPSLVRALVVPDAPTAMLWVGAPPLGTAPVRELLSEVDRLIVDTRRLPGEEGLGDLERLGHEQPDLEIADLAWMGISPLRGLCASLFDPPRDPGRLERLERIRVASGVRGTQARGLLTLGWLAARLRLELLARGPGAAQVRSWRARRPDGGEVELMLETRLEGADHGVVGLELTAAGGVTYSLQRDQHCIAVRGPDGPPRMQPARSHSDADLVVSALGVRGRDPYYREALAMAVRLVRPAEGA